MNDKMKRWIFLLLSFVIGSGTFAQTYTFIAEAPDAVAVGEQFRLTFSLTALGCRKGLEAKNFVPPSFNGFDRLMGPSRSNQTSTRSVIGETITDRTTSLTYVLKATRKGDFQIGAATVEANGIPLTSNGITIKVLPANTASSSSKNGEAIGNDLFMTATTNKLAIYEDESFKLTYKVYTLSGIKEINDVSFPLKSVSLTPESKYPSGRNFSIEAYQGKNYRTVTYRRFILSPRQTGPLTIGEACFEATLSNGETKKICTPEVTIQVYPLPIETQSTSNEDAQRGIRLYKNESYASALPLLQRAAKSGNLQALSYLGNMYLLGLGVNRNYTNAMNMYRRGADNGSAFCLFHQGIMYYNGLGVTIDQEKALELFRQAADRGNASAHFILSRLYNYGHLVNRDEAKAKMHRKICNDLDRGSLFGYSYTNNMITINP